MALHARTRRRPLQHFNGAVALAICAGLLAGQAARAGGKNKPQKESRRLETHEIESLEKRWRNALLSGDASMLDSILSDDFLAISARGTLSDKQQYMQRIAAHTTQLSSLDVTDVKVHAKPGSAVVMSQANIVGTLEGAARSGRLSLHQRV